ncbi:MAG TPA: hypothetical protein VJJ98_09570 [Sedimentisphaerales bacterium]|nr:hypothetical protein [Sedimentisphaerales bacterium]
MADTKKLLIALRLMLFSAGIAWSVSVFGVFLPWPVLVDQLVSLGAESIPSDRMLNYWFRMTATTFTAIGILFLILAAFPRKYMAFIPFAGFFLLVEGCVLMTYGLLLDLGPLPFCFDTFFCLIVGSSIMITQRKIREIAVPGAPPPSGIECGGAEVL